MLLVCVLSERLGLGIELSFVDSDSADVDSTLDDPLLVPSHSSQVWKKLLAVNTVGGVLDGPTLS